jgi:hypothetical protein
VLVAPKHEHFPSHSDSTAVVSARCNRSNPKAEGNMKAAAALASRNRAAASFNNACMCNMNNLETHTELLTAHFRAGSCKALYTA